MPDNELIFDLRPWIGGLPGSIEAFFLRPSSSPEDVASTTRAHAAFKREYGIKVPMLSYDPSDRQHPFKLRNSSLSSWCVCPSPDQCGRALGLNRRVYGLLAASLYLVRCAGHDAHPCWSACRSRCGPESGGEVVMRRGMKTMPCGRLMLIQQRLAQLTNHLVHLVNASAQYAYSLG